MVEMRPLVRALVAGAFLLLPGLASAQQTTWYLAEGATGPAFEQEILAVNPNDQAATGTVTIYKGGVAIPVPFAIPGKRRITLPVNSVPGLAEGETSAKIETDVPIFVERTMYWQGKQGGHNAGAIGAPALTWYLAEGAASDFFSTFILLVNANSSATNVTLSLLKDDGTKADYPYTLEANSRKTVFVNELLGNAPSSFSAQVTSVQPIFVERAMYWLGFAGGHDATAVTAPATTWRFAEGFTDSDFETYFLVANPGNAGGTVTLDFYLDNGATITKTVPIAPTSRVTVRVRNYAELANAAFGTRITADVPVVAERAMYWGGYQEGHATAGLTADAPKWIFAEGLDGTHSGVPYETFFLFMNSSSSPVNITGTFYREDGYGSQQQFTVPANSRYTLFGGSAPHMAGQKFGAVFEGDANFMVERAVYWGAGRFGGHVSTGTPWTGSIGVPANPPAPPPPPPPPAAPNPPQPPVCTALICDNLQGSTVGSQIGGHFDGFGYVISDDNHGIRYTLPTITKGYFEMEITGMRVANWDEKWKIMGMYDGSGGWSSSDLYRFSLEHRYRPDRAHPWNRFLRLKVLNGSGEHGEYIESDTAASVGWNPSEIYKFRFEWGDGRARLTVTTSNGTVVGHLDKPYGHGGPYAPPLHMFSVGNPVGGDHGTVPGLRVRNVRIGRN
jgi:hypothetical protein